MFHLRNFPIRHVGRCAERHLEQLLRLTIFAALNKMMTIRDGVPDPDTSLRTYGVRLSAFNLMAFKYLSTVCFGCFRKSLYSRIRPLGRFHSPFTRFTLPLPEELSSTSCSVASWISYYGSCSFLHIWSAIYSLFL